MNKTKINELYERAHVVHEIRYESSVVDPAIVSVHKQRVFDRFLFAELIVKECMTTVLKESKWYWDKDEFESSNAIQNAARRVKEHFGVEE